MKHYIYGPGVSGSDFGADFFWRLGEISDWEMILPAEFQLSYLPDIQRCLAQKIDVLPFTIVRGLTLAVIRSIVLPEKFPLRSAEGNLFEELTPNSGAHVTPVRQGLRNSYSWSYNQRLIPEDLVPVLASCRSSV
jgi:hypothetical protein